MASLVTPSSSSGSAARSRRLVVLAVAGATGLTMLVVPSTQHADAAATHSHSAVPAGSHGQPTSAPIRTAAQLQLHDQMRKLWEDHVTWTRLAIVSFAADLPDLSATTNRLLANQTDIGDAIKPYYGDAAGDRLTVLLREHITTAVDILAAATAGDSAGVQRASDRWYANADQIADFLAAANPHLSRTTMRAMMREHLDETLAEAVHRLNGDFAADVRDYDAVHHHILVMADTISDAIMQQFPQRFR
jgi:hypothetical protein